MDSSKPINLREIMQNRKQIVEEIAADFVKLKRRMMMGHRHPLKDQVTPAQAQLLFLVHHQEGITTSEIAKQLSTTASAVTQLVDGLVEKGFLIREIDASDRRIYLIKISPEADQHLTKMKAHGLRQIATIFEVLDDNELLVYKELNKKIISAAVEKGGCKDARE